MISLKTPSRDRIFGRFGGFWRIRKAPVKINMASLFIYAQVVYQLLNNNETKR